MRVERLGTVLPVENLAEAVQVWSAILGTGPTFVDGARWAQFDVAGTRLSLAGTDRETEAAGLMIRTDDLDRAHAEAVAAGWAPGPVRQGPHERRFVFTAPGGWAVTVYAPA